MDYAQVAVITHMLLLQGHQQVVAMLENDCLLKGKQELDHSAGRWFNLTENTCDLHVHTK